MAKRQAKKVELGAYARSNTIDKSKLRKYIKSVAVEAKHWREARKE